MKDYYLSPEDYEIARKNGISKRNADNRFYNCDWSKEKAITWPVNGHRYDKKWLDLIKKNNISYSTFVRRVQKGMPEEEAATKPPSKRPTEPTVVTPEIRKLAEEHGIKYQTVYKRIKAGMPPEEAATAKLHSRKRSKFNQYIERRNVT